MARGLTTESDADQIVPDVAEKMLDRISRNRSHEIGGKLRKFNYQTNMKQVKRPHAHTKLREI